MTDSEVKKINKTNKKSWNWSDNHINLNSTNSSWNATRISSMFHFLSVETFWETLSKIDIRLRKFAKTFIPHGNDVFTTILVFTINLDSVRLDVFF